MFNDWKAVTVAEGLALSTRAAFKEGEVADVAAPHRRADSAAWDYEITFANGQKFLVTVRHRLPT